MLVCQVVPDAQCQCLRVCIEEGLCIVHWGKHCPAAPMPGSASTSKLVAVAVAGCGLSYRTSSVA